MHEKLIIFQKAYALLLWFYPVINRIPKSHRIVLGRVLEEHALSLLAGVMKANELRGQSRVKAQLEISRDLDFIRILLRICKDLRFVSIRQYGEGAEKINEIGRILTAWRNA